MKLPTCRLFIHPHEGLPLLQSLLLSAAVSLSLRIQRRGACGGRTVVSRLPSRLEKKRLGATLDPSHPPQPEILGQIPWCLGQWQPPWKILVLNFPGSNERCSTPYRSLPPGPLSDLHCIYLNCFWNVNHWMLINTIIILDFPYGFHLGTGTDIIHDFTRKHEFQSRLMCFPYEINEDIFLLHNQYIRPKMMAFQGRKVVEQLLVGSD